MFISLGRQPSALFISKMSSEELLRACQSGFAIPDYSHMQKVYMVGGWNPWVHFNKDPHEFLRDILGEEARIKEEQSNAEDNAAEPGTV